VIVRRVLGSTIAVLLIIVRAKVTTACVRDDVIIVGIRMATFIQLVAVIEGEARGRRVNKLEGIGDMSLVVVIGVVRFLQDGATLAKVMDGDKEQGSSRSCHHCNPD
jgi:hypothetical protein